MTMKRSFPYTTLLISRLIVLAADIQLYNMRQERQTNMEFLKWTIIIWILRELNAPSVIWLLVAVEITWDLVKTVIGNRKGENYGKRKT